MLPTKLMTRSYFCPQFKDESSTDVEIPMGTKVTYQASSPDEVALVEWCENVGLTLVKRDRNTMQLRTPIGTSLHYQILQVGAGIACYLTVAS